MTDRPPLIVLGTTLFATEIADVATEAGFEVTGYVENLDREKCASDLDGRPVHWIEDCDSLVATHRQTVEALIANCEMMMKQMKMNPPRKWTNAVAQLHQDLRQMTTANAAALHAMWPDHRLRVQGMLDMRHDMMKM